VKAFLALSLHLMLSAASNKRIAFNVDFSSETDKNQKKSKGVSPVLSHCSLLRSS
jgi:hypothetical protein